ncbi:hypothetical protein [Streptomyces capitiformicae]|uniref:Restriction endonuclease subunit S n=1 Tax=Streptomyces capitiformicae TaxID=2014920 RepID=A0A918YZ02_9ACTN|nr:hypothetical protein [Streptomyces capitiformicae]GHE29579.1 hypothetical protein GCM10017771_45490 [Streptomyces capitiformicae]
MVSGLDERLRLLPPQWDVVPLGELRSVQLIGYGITRPGQHTEGGVGMIRAADVQDGQLRSNEPRRIDPRVHEENPRSQLEAGDVVVVLVGRVGQAAVVTEEFRHWNTSRTVGIIRADEPGEAAWLRLWLGSPEVREWCAQQATGSTLHRTLSLAALRTLPVPVPPVESRPALLGAMRLLEAKESTNARIAACATELVDGHFAMLAGRSGAWADRTIGALAELHAGTSSRPRSDDVELPTQQDIDFAAPADILQSEWPHLHETEHHFAAAPKGALMCEPHSLLVASREDGVRAVMNKAPVIPGRGVLVLSPTSVTDALWLLHDIRLRSAELAATAQGSAGREISRRAFAATEVRWPPYEVREQFAQLADRLHERAYTALAENRMLRVLRGRILDSFLSGAFPRKSAS